MDNKRILITGGAGLIGTAIQNQLKSTTEYEILSPVKSELDMTNKDQVDKVFSDFRPDVVINLAAKVGGILANKAHPVEFFEDNLLIGLNTYKYSQKYGVKNIPTVILVENGQEVRRFTGNRSYNDVISFING